MEAQSKESNNTEHPMLQVDDDDDAEEKVNYQKQLQIKE